MDSEIPSRAILMIKNADCVKNSRSISLRKYEVVAMRIGELRGKSCPLKKVWMSISSRDAVVARAGLPSREHSKIQKMISDRAAVEARAGLRSREHSRAGIQAGDIVGQGVAGSNQVIGTAAQEWRS